MSETELAEIEFEPGRPERRARDDGSGTGESDDSMVVESGSDGQRVLAALSDADCQAILDAAAETALSASEISETCDIPLSTAYRKLDTLAELGLVAEGTRIHRSGGDVSEYSRVAMDVLVRITPDGDVKLHMSRRRSPENLGSVVTTGENE